MLRARRSHLGHHRHVGAPQLVLNENIERLPPSNSRGEFANDFLAAGRFQHHHLRRQSRRLVRR
jgi:hypothetical protein